MAALLALTAAAAYGAGDFLGGVASRRAPATAVVLWSHVVGLLVLLVAAPLMGGTPTPQSLGIGALAGLVGAVGVTLFYRGLAIGSMSVVAPVAALVGAVVPVLAGIGGGERPGIGVLLGIGIALIAVTLVSREDANVDVPTGHGTLAILLALGAGLGFGLFFVGIDAADTGSGIWPLVGARAASVLLFSGLGLARVTAAAPPRAVAGAALGAGVLDVAANICYVLALSHGMLSVVSVLTALYPAGTVLLARYVLGERLNPLQQSGMVVAAFAAVLIAA